MVNVAANPEWLGLDFCHMSRGGQNHVTYYKPGKKKRRGGNIMDKESNEAERGEEGGEGKESCTVGVERRRVGGQWRGGEARECASLPAFSHAPSELLRQTEAARERWDRGMWNRGRKNTEEEMRVVRPVRPSKRCYHLKERIRKHGTRSGSCPRPIAQMQRKPHDSHTCMLANVNLGFHVHK